MGDIWLRSTVLQNASGIHPLPSQTVVKVPRALFHKHDRQPLTQDPMPCHFRTSSMSGLQQGQPKGVGVGITPSDVVEMHFARDDFRSMNHKTQM